MLSLGATDNDETTSGDACCGVQANRCNLHIVRCSPTARGQEMQPSRPFSFGRGGIPDDEGASPHLLFSVMSKLRACAVEQFRKIVDIGRACVANYEVTKAALAPCFHVERQFLL